MSALKVMDAQFIDKQSNSPYYYIGANLGDLSAIANLEKADRAKVINRAVLTLQKSGINYVTISLQGMTDSCTNKTEETALDELLQHFKKHHISVTIGIPIPNQNTLDDYEKKVRDLIAKYNNTGSKKSNLGSSIMAWKLYEHPSTKGIHKAFYSQVGQVISWIKSVDKDRLLTIAMPIPTDNEQEHKFQSIIDTDGIDFVSIVANPYEIGWITEANLFSGLARVYVRMDERLDACNRIAQRVGKPYILDEVSYPRDAMAHSVRTLSDARDSFLIYIFHKLSDSFQSQTPLSAILFDFDLLNEPSTGESDGQNEATESNDWKAKAVFPSDSKSLEIISSAMKTLK